MPLPKGWPPRPATGVRSIRVRITGTANAAYDNNAFLFSQVANANTLTPTPYVAPGASTPAAFGTLASGGPPMGGGVVNPRDVLLGETEADTPVPMLWCETLLVRNKAGVDLLFSFDGVHDHGLVPANSERVYRNRREAGIALKGNGDFEIEAW